MEFAVKTFYFTQIDGSVPHGCLKILISPDEKKKPHAVVVGDSKGQLHYYEMRDSALVEKIKTEATGKSTAKLEKLPRTAKGSERLMTAFGSQIAAYNIDGKQLFFVDSNLSEVLKWTVAEENKFVFACGEFMLNFYLISDAKFDDVFQYICPSEILEAWVDSFDGFGYYVTLLCKDKKLRVVNEKGVVYETKLDYNAHCCYPFNENAFNFVEKKQPGRKQLLLGMSNGEVRCYTMTQFDARLDWTVKPTPEVSKAEATFIRLFKLSRNPKSDLIVARSDGTIEFLAQKGQEGQFERICHCTIPDTITGMEGSFFHDQPMMIASTFSGKLVGISLKNEYNTLQLDETAGIKAEQARQIAALKAEIDDLEKKLVNAKKAVPVESDGSTFVDNKLTYSLKKNESGGNKFDVTISSQENFRNVVVKKMHSTQIHFATNMPGLLIENPNEYLVSDFDFTSIDFSKCSASVLKVVVEPEEGMTCEPTFIISPERGEGFAQSLRIAIKPLSSHEKVPECPTDRAYNRLTVKGSFDVNLMNNWLFNILSDISVNIVEKEIEYHYYSQVTDCYLKLKVRDNLVNMEAESIVAIAIVKDCLSRYAEEASTSLSFDWQTDDSTIKKVLRKVATEFNALKDLETRFKLVEPIEEVAQLESEEIKISEKYKNILFNRKEIEAQYHRIPKDMLHFRAVVVNLARSYQQLKGQRTADRSKTVDVFVKQIAESYEQRFDPDTVFKLIVE